MRDVEFEEEKIEENFNDPEDEFIKIYLKKPKLIVIFSILAFSIGILTGYLVWGQGSNSELSIVQTVNNQPTQQEQVDPVEIIRYDVPIDDDPTLGDEDAPITIIEFSDYECPYCTKFHNETFSQLMDTYGDQIRFVYRDFPLTSIHSEAFPAAEAANCSGEQGKYWEFHNLLFIGGPENLGTESYNQYAETLKLDLNKFQECVISRKYQAEVQADLDYAASLGVRSTPTFFINGIPLIGAQPFEMFSQLIESELAGELP